MKNNLVYLFTLLLVVTLTSCDDTPVVFDNINGQVAVKFEQTTYPNTTVPTGGATISLPVSVTTLSTTDRTFKAVADAKSTGPAASYSIGDVTIPAGSYTGSVVVTLLPTSLVDGISYSLILNLVAPAGGSSLGTAATLKYNKKVICNDVVLKVTTDAYAEETSWKIVNAAGVVVASIPPGTYGPASSVASRGKVYTHNINLPNGKYKLIMQDIYPNDGQFDGTYSGSYKLSCSIITHAEGTGGWTGLTEETQFEINP